MLHNKGKERVNVSHASHNYKNSLNAAPLTLTLLPITYLTITMSDWDEPKTVIGFKRQVAKVAKKDSDINGPLNSRHVCTFLTQCFYSCGSLIFSTPRPFTNPPLS